MRKILMVNLPYAGHTNPTLPLAAELVKRGHHVGYINAPEWKQRIEETGVHFIPYINYPQAPSPQQKKMRCIRAAYDTVMAVGAAYDMLLYEMLFFPGLETARRLNLIPVRQFSQPGWNAASAAEMRSSTRLWAMSCKLIDMQMFTKKTARHLKMEGKNLVMSVIHEVPDLNIVYVPEAMQPCRDAFDDRFVFTGPTIAYQEPHTPAFDFDTMPKPIVYISMGSIISSKRFCRRCIKAFGDRPGTYILSTGRVNPDALGTLPGNFIARSFVPQLEVLAHADLFITHGGMNSVNEAIYFGVPMLVTPILNDQPMNARQIERNRIGLKLRAFPSNAERLSTHAEMVLGDANIRQSTKALQEKVRATAGIHEAANRLENLF